MTERAPASPNATYRLQFSSAFTFRDATAIVPYLAALGISHVYASPFLQARSGSTHGYDIVDFNRLNAELGSEDDFHAFIAALHAHGLGLILDFVPNHMGIFEADNGWWLDVLEYGEGSPYAHYFDIDWRPPKAGLGGKVLVPVLGDHYGATLRRGELTLACDPCAGSFSVWYHEHRFPIAPRTYPRVLQRILAHAERDSVEERIRGNLASLTERFRTLSGWARSPGRRRSRREAAEAFKTELAALMQGSEALQRSVEAAVAEINGEGTDPGGHAALHRLLEVQAYRLAYWRVAAHEINYRRFFEINDLAGIRVERPEVFEATHKAVLGWVREGVIDGLRIDHIDGLFDPARYCASLVERMSAATASQGSGASASSSPYILVEKILAHHEHLPEDWPVAGTTGYDFLNQLNGLFVDPQGEQPLDIVYRRFTGERASFDEVLDQCKRRMMDHELVSELNVLANELDRISEANRQTRDYTREGLREALREVIACFTVYRTYVTGRQCTQADRRYIDWAISQAKKRSVVPDISIFDFIHAVLTTDLVRARGSGFPRSETVRVAMKFQQYTGPVMAKSLEDTAFYRYVLLLSLNEVGGDPRRFGVSVNAFHHANQERLRRWPNAMLATSTHDTKRGEDVRARLNVLSELDAEWGQHVYRWARLNRRHKTRIDDHDAPMRSDEYLLYQTLVGAWPVELLEGLGDAGALAAFRKRVGAYAIKSVREAKQVSSWASPNPAYETAITGFIDRILAADRPNPFLESLLPFVRRVAAFGMVNSLAQLTLKLTVPGVSDTYQGAELWDLSLVDPDNRRPVDYDMRNSVLESLAASSDASVSDRLLRQWCDGRIKLHLLRSILRLRQEVPGLFLSGSYLPLETRGARAEHLCAFARVHGDTALLVAVPRLVVGLCGDQSLPLGEEVWGDSAVLLPNSLGFRQFRDRLTSAELVPEEWDGSACLHLRNALARFPVGVLFGR